MIRDEKLYSNGATDIHRNQTEVNTSSSLRLWWKTFGSQFKYFALVQIDGAHFSDDTFVKWLWETARWKSVTPRWRSGRENRRHGSPAPSLTAPVVYDQTSAAHQVFLELSWSGYSRYCASREEIDLCSHEHSLVLHWFLTPITAAHAANEAERHSGGLV